LVSASAACLPAIYIFIQFQFLPTRYFAGPNVVHYPPNARVIALDPNPYMEDYFERAWKKV
jgi:hypothetical protein